MVLMWVVGNYGYTNIHGSILKYFRYFCIKTNEKSVKEIMFLLFF